MKFTATTVCYLPLLKGQCYSDNFLRLLAHVEIDRFHSLLWRSKTNCNISRDKLLVLDHFHFRSRDHRHFV